MKFFKIMLALYFLISLGACTKEVIKEVKPNENQGLPAPQDTVSDGGVDGGGGSGVNGKPLESFLVEIEKNKEFDQVVKPLIFKLAELFPELAADLMHIAKERAWYFVPVKLKDIPYLKVGTYFPTEQLALQNLREIWFDDKLYSNMQEDDRVNIIMHELVMGVLLLNYSTKLENCLAQTNRHVFSDNVEARSTDRKKCMKLAKDIGDSWNQLTPISGIKLSKTDYANVRELTVKITKKINELSAEEIKNWVELRKFRTYFDDNK